MINRYPGNCALCSCSVAAERGVAVKSDSGRWRVYCRPHAPGAVATASPGSSGGGNGNGGHLPAVAGPAPAPARKLTKEGVVQTPYEPGNLPLLRSFPGARWDKDAKHWRVSVAPGDLARTLELADTLKLEVDAELRAAAAVRSTAAEKIARDPRLYPFQVMGVDWLAKRQRALLADEMGLGKTVQTLCALAEGWRVLVVAPASLKLNWRNEALKWSPNYRVSVVSGRDGWRWPEPGEIVIANYDVLPAELYQRRDKESERDTAARGNAWAVEHARGVSLIVDEAHFCKSGDALRSKRVRALTAACERTWALTGTPLVNRPMDLWGTLRSLQLTTDVFGSFNKFVQLFHGSRNRWGGYEWGRPDIEVAERLRRVSLRRRRDEVLPDLPRKQIQTQIVNGLDPALKAELDQVWEEIQELVLYARTLPDFSRYSAIRRKLALSKIPALLEIAEEYEEAEEPLVVFSCHRDPVLELGKRPGWATILGDTPVAARQQAVDDFQAGRLRGLALTVAAGGVGITLTRGHHCIFVDLDWNPSGNSQAEDRLCRIGQKADSVHIVRLVANHAMDERVTELLAWKTDIIQRAVEARLEAAPPTEGQATAVAPAALVNPDEVLEAAERVEAKVQRVLEHQRERAHPACPELPLTPARRATVHEALHALLAVCDGASALDGQGFNKPDANLSRWLAIVENDSDDWVRAAERMLTRYHRQLSERFPLLWREA